MSEKKEVGTPSWHPFGLFAANNLRHFDPICSLVPDGSTHLFFRSFDRVNNFTQHSKKIKEIGFIPQKLWPF